MGVGPIVDVRVVEEGEGYVVEASGELDLGAVEAMTRAVMAVRAARLWADQPLVIDLADVGFMDSEGLRALLVARQLGGGSPRSVVLRNPSERVLATLALAGLGDAFVLDLRGRAPAS
jgi:anti-anti-sigma factor